MDAATRLNRLEQQLAAFEKLHTGELSDFEERLAAYVKLHADEVKMLRSELAGLKKVIEEQRSFPDSGSQE